jgi:outer membrane autotransporter protein
VLPGGTNIIQQTTMTGNFQQASNGSLQVKLASASSYDALSLTGTAALNGSLSVFRYTNYLPVKGNEFVVLSAGSITNQFATLSDPYKGNYALRLNPIYSLTNLILQVVQDSFAQFATTGNQRSLSSNIDSFSGLGGTNGDPRGAPLVTFLNTQTSAQLPNDLDLLAPEELGAMFDLNFASVNTAIGNVRERMGEIRSGNHGASSSISVLNQRDHAVQLASAGQGLPPMTMEKSPGEWSVFAAGNGQYVDVTGSANAAGYHFHSAGATLGLDKMFAPNLAAGFTLDYSGTTASLVNGGVVNVDGGRAGVYGTWFQSHDVLEASLGGGFNHYTTTREALGGTALGSTDGEEVDAMLGYQHDFTAGHFTFGPTVNGQYTWVQVNEFTESGSLAPLQLQDNVSQSFLTRLGGQVAYDWKLTGVTLRPGLQLAWQHEWLDNDRAIDSRFASGAGSVFRVNSAAFGRDSLALDAGISAQWSQRFSTFLSYHGDLLRTDYIAHTISLGLDLKF